MNRRRTIAMACVLALGAGAAVAEAYEFRHRFVWRANGQDIPIHEQLNIPVPPYDREVHIRLQFGVFDDANGPAPVGGFIGWNTGSLWVNSRHNWQITRTPGRLAPFTFYQGSGSNGVPFMVDSDIGWREIDAVMGLQTPVWAPGSDPTTPPPPVIYGRNDWVSVYEISVRGLIPYTYLYGEIHFEGQVYGAREWRTVGTPIPPEGDEYGLVTYAPYPLGPVPINGGIRIQNMPVPGAGPGTAALIGIAFYNVKRRRVYSQTRPPICMP